MVNEVETQVQTRPSGRMRKYAGQSNAARAAILLRKICCKF